MPDTLLLLAAVGYGLAALAYLGLSGLIVASWRRRSQGRLLVLATGLSATWGAFSALTALGALPPRADLAVEVARNGAWLALLLYILHLRLPSDASLPAPLRLVRFLSGVLVCALFIASVYPFFAPTQPVLARWAGNLGLVMLAVLGLVLTEQVYRSTRPEDRWAIKFLCLGLGGLFVYDFYLYANAALFNAMDAQVWAARGYVAALVTPLIAVSAARNPEWAAPVGLSRSMVFHTTSLLGAGIYLLLMAGAGYYLRLFGGEWGDVVQTVFIFAAAMLLVLLMFSGTHSCPSIFSAIATTTAKSGSTSPVRSPRASPVSNCANVRPRHWPGCSKAQAGPCGCVRATPAISVPATGTGQTSRVPNRPRLPSYSGSPASSG